MHQWKDEPICTAPVCINSFGLQGIGITNSFENVMTAMDWFNSIGNKKRKLLETLNVITVGLGHCDTLYKGDIRNIKYL